MMFDPAQQIEAANALAATPGLVLRREMASERVAGPPGEAQAPELQPPQEMKPLPVVQPVPATQPMPAMPPPPAMQPTPSEGEARPEAPRAPSESAAAVQVEMQRQSDAVKLVFPFSAPTSGAVFRRSDTLWIVLDSPTPIDIGALHKDQSHTIADAAVVNGPDYQIVRVKLERPRLTSFSTAEDSWIVSIGDAVLDPTLPLAIGRNAAGTARPAAVAPFEHPQALHRLADPAVGDSLLVVTGFAPARGLLKEQDFVEFRMLASVHGIVVQPVADDVDVELSSDKVLISRPAGLVLSPANQTGQRGYRPVVLDAESWGFDRKADFAERQKGLITAAAAAPENNRMAARFELARFYLAREMFAEAKGVLDVAIGDDHPTAEDPTGLVMRAIAKMMMGRVEEGLQDLASPLVGDKYDAQLWRGVAYAQRGKWAERATASRRWRRRSPRCRSSSSDR